MFHRRDLSIAQIYSPKEQTSHLLILKPHQLYISDFIYLDIDPATFLVPLSFFVNKPYFVPISHREVPDPASPYKTFLRFEECVIHIQNKYILDNINTRLFGMDKGWS